MAIDRSKAQPDDATEPIEDSMPPAKRKQLQRCFERGIELAKKDKADLDYAHDMFSECVVQDPGNLVYTEALLDNLQRKYKNNKKGARFKGFGGRNSFKKAVAAQDWKEVFREGLEILKTNPWDVPTLRALADACRANRFNEVELRYLKNALDANPKDVQVNRHCAFSLTRMGQFDQAIACWHRIEELERNNDEAPKMISQLSVAKQKLASGTDLEYLLAGLTGSPLPAQSAPKPAKETKPAKATGQPEADAPTEPAAESSIEAGETRPRKVELTPRQQLENAIREDPTELANYVALANRLADDGRLKDAQKVLQKGLEASGGDIKMRELLEDMMLRRQRADISIAEKKLAVDKDDAARELVERLKSELNHTELDLFAQRVERYPDDRALKLELGQRLKKAANYEAAAPLLEEAAQQPDLEPAATLDLGECLQHLKQYSKSVRAYQSASRAAQRQEDRPRRLLALYRMGVLAAALKESRVAQSAFASLLELDANYRDAADRLDKLQQIEHNQ